LCRCPPPGSNLIAEFEKRPLGENKPPRLRLAPPLHRDDIPPNRQLTLAPRLLPDRGRPIPEERFHAFLELIANAAECSQTLLFATLDCRWVF
jgi:hypothetical protein